MRNKAVTISRTQKTRWNLHCVLLKQEGKKKSKTAENICKIQKRLKHGAYIDQAMGNIDCRATENKTKQHRRIRLYETFAASFYNLIIS